MSMVELQREEERNGSAAALRTSVYAAVDHAQGDCEQARRNIEDWYDSAMDRVAGWYKKRTQFILFAIGLVLAVALNVDTITIAKHL